MPAPELRPRLTVRFSRPSGGHYPVFVGSGILRHLPRILRRFAPAHRYFLITDSTVARLHGRAVHSALRKSGLRADFLMVAAGERSKTRESKARLEDRMLALGGGRDSAVIAIGGGMVGDLAGFTAATYLRGIPFVAVPTTLLAMVDAALGGKTAVDHPRGKNLIGAFHHPKAVLADVQALRTLSEREYRSGLAEVVKTAVVGDAALFRRLERSTATILSRHPEALAEVITACCRLKARVVAADEREAGLRVILNFGHTLGHALEHLSRYRLAHGEAVAIGMVLEARAAEAAGIMKRGEPGRIEALLTSLGIPLTPPKRLSAARILAAARVDKKSRHGTLLYAVPRRVGRMAGMAGRFTRTLPAGALAAVLKQSTE
ncbi:MAG: 3-dehydroquinate synthase [Acidobacteria bacterium]|nr:3-dehydroquinate synthase [Acidobacteriota bacterium]